MAPFLTILALMPETATLTARAQAIASNRELGAAELLAQLLPLLEEAVTEGRDATMAAARLVCAGQPAMASLWNACAAALAEFAAPGRFARVKAEMERAPQALQRAVAAAMRDVMLAAPPSRAGTGAMATGTEAPRLLTLSYSSGVAAALGTLAGERALEVICAESLPGGEGARMARELAASGARTTLVADALLTTHLPGATGVIVGADALSAQDWTNKAGTLGLAAAAASTSIPVFVVTARHKAQCATLRQRAPLPPLFERTPLGLATLVLTDAGSVPPDAVPGLSERFAPDLDGIPLLMS